MPLYLGNEPTSCDDQVEPEHRHEHEALPRASHNPHPMDHADLRCDEDETADLTELKAEGDWEENRKHTLDRIRTVASINDSLFRLRLVLCYYSTVMAQDSIM